MELICDAKILDEILVLGYHKVPTYTDLLTAELITVSSKSNVRLTVSQHMATKIHLLLKQC